jgi:ankyrin repeat protein
VLISAGVDVDKKDRNNWSALMWAMTNRHKAIAKLLLDNGASTEAKTNTGRTAFDFVPPDSEMSFYLHDNGYNIGNAGVTEDFYNPGFSQDRFEEEMAENEMRRRMMMESARDLEVDLGNVGMDDQPEASLRFVLLGTFLTACSLWMSLRRSSKSLNGIDASMIRCLSSKKRSWNEYWTSLSRT